MSARAFESYLISKLQDQGASNNYLANIIDEKAWGEDEKLGMELEDSYPYPKDGEMPSIRTAFEHFFNTIQSKDTDTGTALYSIAPKDADFAQDILNELSEVDELFRYAVSDKTTLAGVLQDTAPAFKYVGDETRADEKQETGADSRLLFKTDKGKPFYIYERDGELWIDVSRLDTGDRGSAIYAAVGNYAFNTGKVFIGDPEGLSDDAVIRRTSNMLSLALRFGTTDFMEPSPEKKAGIPSLGVAPLKWQGSDVDKTKAMIDTFLSTLNHQFPELKHARYDFDKRQFVTRGSGRLLDWEKFDRRAKDTGTGRTARAGEATARRGIFIQSLVSSPGGQRPGILEHVLSRANQLVTKGGLKGLFSATTSTSNKPTATGLAADQIRALLPRYVGRLVKSGKLQVVQSAKDAPETANSFDAGGGLALSGVEGYYDPKNDIVYVIADNVTQDNLKSVINHELFHRA
ncbi:MAG: LPD1 domain-containing protein [Methyloglobulus sp.]|nr:hypothetical protein [Methyloglobulus sp.]